MLAFSNDYYGMIFRATQSVELFCAYYDSAGIAVRDGSNLAEVVKATGKLRNLSDKTDDGNAIHGTCGIVIQDGLFPYFL